MPTENSISRHSELALRSGRREQLSCGERRRLIVEVAVVTVPNGMVGLDIQRLLRDDVFQPPVFVLQLLQALRLTELMPPYFAF